MTMAGLRAESRARAEPGNPIAVVDYDLCHYCGACVAVCPPDALFLTDARLEVMDACTGCGRCVKVCPVFALSVVERNAP
jgi:ferredoxin